MTVSLTEDGSTAGLFRGTVSTAFVSAAEDKPPPPQATELWSPMPPVVKAPADDREDRCWGVQSGSGRRRAPRLPRNRLAKARTCPSRKLI